MAKDNERAVITDIQRTVLQVVPRLITGGVERGTIEMAAALKAAGWRAIVVSEGGKMVEELDHLEILHIPLPVASKNIFTMKKNIDELADIIHEHNVDIIHARSRAPAWSAYFAARQTGRHFVTTFHSAYSAGSWLKRLYNSVMAKGEIVIAISNSVGEYAKTTYRIPEERLRIIARGVDTNRFNRNKIEQTRIVALREHWNLSEDERMVLLPGRLSSWKGQLVFIEAIARLKQPKITFLMAGDSNNAPYRRELEAAITKYKLNGHVRLVGDCDDMPAAFCLAEIVVSASTRPEGFGRIIVEAQAMGCAVIATRHGGAEETILNGKTGWLITPGDSKILAEALRKILSMKPEVLQKIGEQAKTHVRANFSTALMTQRTIAVYEELITREMPEPSPPLIVLAKVLFKNAYTKLTEKPVPVMISESMDEKVEEAPLPPDPPEAPPPLLDRAKAWWKDLNKKAEDIDKTEGDDPSA